MNVYSPVTHRYKDFCYDDCFAFVLFNTDTKIRRHFQYVSSKLTNAAHLRFCIEIFHVFFFVFFSEYFETMGDPSAAPITTNTSTSTTTSTTTSVLTTVLNNATSLVTNLTTTTSIRNSSLTTTMVPRNSSTIYEECLLNNPLSTCRLAESIRVLAYFLLAVSLGPQIIHLFRFGSKYIAGISYSWIVLRALALAGLMMGHVFNWSTIFEFLALVSAVMIFLEIVIFAENLHRQQRLTLVGVTLITWIIGITLIVTLRNRVTFLVPLSHTILAIHMLPQVKTKKIFDQIELCWFCFSL